MVDAVSNQLLDASSEKMSVEYQNWDGPLTLNQSRSPHMPPSSRPLDAYNHVTPGILLGVRSQLKITCGGTFVDRRISCGAYGAMSSRKVVWVD